LPPIGTKEPMFILLLAIKAQSSSAAMIVFSGQTGVLKKIIIFLSNLRPLIEFMRTMQKVILLLFTFAVSFEINAQNYFFAEARESEISAAAIGKRVIIPEKYKTLVLDTRSIQSFLGRLPIELRPGAIEQGQIIELPMPDGGKAKYRIWESPVMEKGLAEKFPQIKTYTGQGIDDPTATIKIDFTELGFHAMVLSDITGNIFIDPYRQFDTRNYISYYKKDLLNKHPFECGVSEIVTDQGKPAGNRPMAGPCVGTQLRSYRLAVACTGEYARKVAGNSATVAQTLSAIVTSINRVDGVYEKEVAISLNLVANNDLVVFTNPSTDPFTANDDGSALLDESQTVIDANIGSANYDIGHTFSTGGGGIAQLGSVCGSQKARGVTGSDNPVGDAYDIDYVAHEMGHQFDASHSFNATSSSCGGNRNSITAVEPGSGVTIMSYAGLCSTNDLAQNSIPYFHGISMDEINTFTTTGGGSTCASVTATGNIIPIVNAGNNFTIPKSTPFVLTGSATDGNSGDVLTYSWEQVDTGPAGDWNNPTDNAPLFRSFAPVSVPERHFPKISDQINNTTTIGEILPSYGRNMSFRLTARDNHSGGTGVCFKENFITVNGSSGPFVVTVPSASGITWSGGSTQTVSWSVAGTNVSPVSCTNVSIELSADGGNTFPITILASTPNDGSEQITVPNNVTTTARIRIKAVGNIFYDISNNNFTITVPQAGFDFTTPEAAKVACADPSSTSITLGTVSVLGYSTPITLSVSGNPPGTTVSLSATTVTPGQSVQVTLNNTDLLPFDSSYDVTVTGVSGSISKSQKVTYAIQTGTGPAISSQPQDVQVCKGSNATFTVASSSDIKSYQWQVSNNGGQSYNNISGATSSSYTLTSAETVENGFLYRVLLRGQCNVTASDPATLTVYTLPAVTLVPSLTSIVPGETSTLMATIIPGSSSAVTAAWFKDGDEITVTGNSLPVTVTGLGAYQVKLLDDNGCTNESAVVTISAKASAQLFIYPNPTDGRFTLSYYNAGGGNTKQSVTIYDAKGAKVYSKVFTFTGPYELHDIDMRVKAKGVYFVVVGDANGKKIIDGKVLVN